MALPPPTNRLLAALPAADLARITARMTLVTFGHKESTYRASGPMNFVYFPRSGALSAVVVMLDGQTAEVAVVGRGGMVGATVSLGANKSSEEVFCQIAPAECWKLPAGDFVAELARGGALRDVVQQYLVDNMATVARLSACNCLHPADERMARWLLTCHDQVGADEFPLTHEFLATMLGVRRATVTVTAGTLQTAGLITYRHGRVRVLDRAGLEEASCECYAVIRDSFTP